MHAVPRGLRLDRADLEPHRARARGTPRTSTSCVDVATNIVGNTICALGDAAAMPVQLVRDEVPRRVPAPHRPQALPDGHAGAPGSALMPKLDHRRPGARGRRRDDDPPGGPDARAARSRTTATTPGLSIAGNCRMCLVEVEKAPEARDRLLPRRSPTAWSCTPRASKVKTARAAMMEFLLINHPLDCPICDQAGECRLQDYAVEHGDGTSRYVGAQARAARRRWTSARTSCSTRSAASSAAAASASATR